MTEMLKYLFRAPGNMQTIEAQAHHKNGSRLIPGGQRRKAIFFQNPTFFGVESSITAT